MGTVYWEGKADAVAQVDSAGISTFDATSIYGITIGGVTVSVAGDTDEETTTDALIVALLASVHPYFAAITWARTGSGGASVVEGTADVAGVPFVFTTFVSGGTGAWGAVSQDTAVSGPNDWSTAANWSTGSVPVASDDVVIAGNVSICWGLDQQAVDLDSLTIPATYTGRIGLRKSEFATSADGATTDASKVEYRAHYLDIESDKVDIGGHDGPGRPTGSGRIKLDLGVHETTVVVHSTSRTPAESGMPAVRLLMEKNTSDVFIRSATGGVGIAVDEPGETSTVRKVSVSDDSADSVVLLGSGVTPSAYEQRGGSAVLRAAATVPTVDVDGGELRLEGDFAVTTITVEGGVLIPNNVPAAGAAIATLNMNGGFLNGVESNRARTWTTVNLKADEASFKIDPAVVTLTNNLALV